MAFGSVSNAYDLDVIATPKGISIPIGRHCLGIRTADLAARRTSPPRARRSNAKRPVPTPNQPTAGAPTAVSAPLERQANAVLRQESQRLLRREQVGEFRRLHPVLRRPRSPGNSAASSSSTRRSAVPSTPAPAPCANNRRARHRRRAGSARAPRDRGDGCPRRRCSARARRWAARCARRRRRGKGVRGESDAAPARKAALYTPRAYVLATLGLQADLSYSNPGLPRSWVQNASEARFIRHKNPHHIAA